MTHRRMTPEQQAEIDAATENLNISHRPVSDGAERHMFLTQPVLDHGFVRLVDYMGNDAAVVQAARVSYGAGTTHVQNDEGLIRYLMRRWHSTPFEMCEIKLHVKLPVFVARQWIRHRTANINEYSARYSILNREFYIPEPENIAVQAIDNKQGRSEVLNINDAETIRKWLLADANEAYDSYEAMSDPDGHYGIARELARINLPVNIYTEWYWKVDLHNLFHFLRLRADAHAQYEIRVYADAICKIVADWVPLSYRAFEDYRKDAVSLSAAGMDCVRRMIKGEQVSREASGMSATEWSDFQKDLANG